MKVMTPEHLDNLRELAEIASCAEGDECVVLGLTREDAEALRAAVEALERVAERDGDGV